MIPVSEKLREEIAALRREANELRYHAARRDFARKLQAALRQFKYSPDQPRDDHGRWARVLGEIRDYLQRHGGDILDGALLAGTFIPEPAEPEFLAAWSARRAQATEEYLATARNLPPGVTRIGSDIAKLTPQQLKSLKRFKAKGAGFKNPEIVNLSDGSAIYSAKVPAKNIPGSYKIYEKHVSPGGEKIKMPSVTVGPRGELVNIKMK